MTDKNRNPTDQALSSLLAYNHLATGSWTLEDIATLRKWLPKGYEPLSLELIGDTLYQNGDKTGALESYHSSHSLSPNRIVEQKIFLLEKKQPDKQQTPNQVDMSQTSTLIQEKKQYIEKIDTERKEFVNIASYTSDSSLSDHQNEIDW